MGWDVRAFGALAHHSQCYAIFNLFFSDSVLLCARNFQRETIVEVYRGRTESLGPHKVYLRPLVVEGMKTCQVQVVSDLVKPPKKVVSCRELPVFQKL